jgi:tetraacyldisaccharide 4'-kinase
MDDGLQNASLVKDFTLAVVDARRGIGNGRVFPAGPLRAPLDVQLTVTNALLVVGDGNGVDTIIAAARARGLPVFYARLVPDAAAPGNLQKRRVLAFAGIGDPEKFFLSAREAGIDIAERRAFPDHHCFTAVDAEHDGLALLTTEKDRARMTGDPLMAALAAKAHVLPVTMKFADADGLQQLLTAKLRR